MPVKRDKEPVSGTVTVQGPHTTPFIPIRVRELSQAEVDRLIILGHFQKGKGKQK